MDPNAALDELLTLLDRTSTLSEMHLPPRVLTHDMRRIIELVEALDSWLTYGGFLPDRWKPACRRAVCDDANRRSGFAQALEVVRAGRGRGRSHPFQGTVRARWCLHTAETRGAADRARAELADRGVDPDRPADEVSTAGVGVASLLTASGSDLSEAPVLGFEPAALDFVAAPRCPSGPVLRASVSEQRGEAVVVGTREDDLRASR